MTNSTAESGGSTGDDRTVGDLTQNYYNQHRNVMIFALLLMFIDVSGATLKDSVDSTIGGGLSFSGTLDISLIFLFLLLYSYLYFVAEWFWQAKPQYELGVNELRALSLRMEHEISPLRSQVAQSSSEFHGALSEMRQLANLQPGESLSPAEDKALNIISGVGSQASLMKGMLDRIFVLSPHGYVTESNGIYKRSSEDFSKDSMDEDIDHIIKEFNSIKSEVSALEENVEWVRTEQAVVLNMFKKRAIASTSEFDKIVTSLIEVAEKYDRLGFPKKIRNRSRATRFLSIVLSWGFGFWIPTCLFVFAMAVHLIDPLRISLEDLVVK